MMTFILLVGIHTYSLLKYDAEGMYHCDRVVSIVIFLELYIFFLYENLVDAVQKW